MHLTGLLPLNKPYDMRSTQCVELARRILGRKVKVGHGGTLDSTASGLLVLLIGSATRLSNYVMDSALTGFMGWRMQAPPQISAVHIDGQRAHRLVRDGHEVEISEKPVYFAGIKRASGISEEGKVVFHVHCSKGTYIRSFARDLGRRLACCAHIDTLKRVSVGPFSLENSRTADDLFSMKRDDFVKEILPVSSLCASSVCYLPDLCRSRRLANGLSLALKDIPRMNFGKYASASEHIIASSEELFSICTYSPSGGSLEIVPSVNIIYDRSI